MLKLERMVYCGILLLTVGMALPTEVRGGEILREMLKNAERVINRGQMTPWGTIGPLNRGGQLFSRPSRSWQPGIRSRSVSIPSRQYVGSSQVCSQPYYVNTRPVRVVRQVSQSQYSGSCYSQGYPVVSSSCGPVYYYECSPCSSYSTVVSSRPVQPAKPRVISVSYKRSPSTYSTTQRQSGPTRTTSAPTLHEQVDKSDYKTYVLYPTSEAHRAGIEEEFPDGATHFYYTPVYKGNRFYYLVEYPKTLSEEDHEFVIATVSIEKKVSQHVVLRTKSGSEPFAFLEDEEVFYLPG